MTDPPGSADASWIVAGRLADLADGSGREATVGGQSTALFRLGDRVVALGGSCPHRGAHLADGAVDSATRTVTCPRRGCLRWRFDLETGASAGGLAVACPTYPVRVEAGQILVAVPRRS